MRHSSGGLPLREGHGRDAGGPRHRAGVDEPDQLREDAAAPRVRDRQREAARYGVGILDSEIVGLVPPAALIAAAEYYLQIEGFSPSQVLENRLEGLIRIPGPDYS